MRDTIEMAREVGFTVGLGSPALEKFERLVELARADALVNIDPSKMMSYQEGFEAGRFAEREACAKVCDDLSLSQNSEWEVGTLDCAEAIRARGETNE
jgi:hypothetical protein